MVLYIHDKKNIESKPHLSIKNMQKASNNYCHLRLVLSATYSMYRCTHLTNENIVLNIRINARRQWFIISLFSQFNEITRLVTSTDENLT